jgi:adenosylcobinamide kinase/adenosylcobinamide-phosphate guanylyltransferase
VKKELVLVLGGARSGKSSFAQQLAARSDSKVLFLATAEASDDEMVKRIAKHKQSRPAAWVTIEEPLRMASTLMKENQSYDLAIVDCLTVWLGNMMFHNTDVSEEKIMQEVSAVLRSYKNGSCSYILISGELGLGVVPENPMGRLFRDIHGRMNQEIAQEADKVFLMIAGIPLEIKGISEMHGRIEKP